MLSMFLIEVAPGRFRVYSAGVSVIAGRVVELDMLFFGHVCLTFVLYIENLSWCVNHRQTHTPHV
jgi:hypothetical protein